MKKARTWGVILVIIVIVLFLALKEAIDFSQIDNINYIIETIRGFGMLGPLLFIIVMAIAIVVSPIPSLPLDAAAGVIWGPYLATLYAVIGAEIGAIIAFLIARHLGRSLIEKALHKDINICNHCSDKTLVAIIFIARLFPFFQFDVISYGAGLTNISLKKFAIATFFGMIPMTFIFALTGKSFFTGTFLSTLLALLLIVAMFIVPMLINRYNLFGLKDKISIK